MFFPKRHYPTIVALVGSTWLALSSFCLGQETPIETPKEPLKSPSGTYLYLFAEPAPGLNDTTIRSIDVEENGQTRSYSFAELSRCFEILRGQIFPFSDPLSATPAIRVPKGTAVRWKIPLHNSPDQIGDVKITLEHLNADDSVGLYKLGFLPEQHIAVPIFVNLYKDKPNGSWTRWTIELSKNDFKPMEEGTIPIIAGSPGGTELSGPPVEEIRHPLKPLATTELKKSPVNNYLYLFSEVSPGYRDFAIKAIMLRENDSSTFYSAQDMLSLLEITRGLNYASVFLEDGKILKYIFNQGATVRWRLPLTEPLRNIKRLDVAVIHYDHSESIGYFKLGFDPDQGAATPIFGNLYRLPPKLTWNTWSLRLDEKELSSLQAGTPPFFGGSASEVKKPKP
jgi:hypothetical protein